MTQIRTSTYLPPLGKPSRKRRRKWKRQILRHHPGLNPGWLDAPYEVAFVDALGNCVEVNYPTRLERLDGPPVPLYKPLGQRKATFAYD